MLTRAQQGNSLPHLVSEFLILCKDSDGCGTSGLQVGVGGQEACLQRHERIDAAERLHRYKEAANDW